MSMSTHLPDLREGEPLPREYLPDVSKLVTEDDTPADSIYAEKQQRLLTTSLYASWNPSEPFLAMANVGLFTNRILRQWCRMSFTAPGCRRPPIRFQRHIDPISCGCMASRLTP